MDGIDIYSTAESNVYQDIFGEAIFIGKGIYNVDVFQKLLKNEIPENTVLSHDLLEGSYLRCGLASDVEIIDGFPSRVNSYMTRLARWTRGDWQIIKWLFKGPLNKLSKYKIFDNIRRSLVDIFTLSLFFAGFIYLPLGIIFAPFVIDIIDRIFNSATYNKKFNNKNYLPIISGIKGCLYRCTLQLIFLPYRALLLLEAIIITIYRMYFSKKHLLEWLTAADAEKILGKNVGCYVKEMMIGTFVGYILMLSSIIYNNIPIQIAFILFTIWLLAPFISYSISMPKENKKGTIKELKENEKEILMDITKRTWNFFNEYMNEENNYLPPDNYQEGRKELVAPRTSSTNIGLRTSCNNFSI